MRGQRHRLTVCLVATAVVAAAVMAGAMAVLGARTGVGSSTWAVAGARSDGGGDSDTLRRTPMDRTAVAEAAGAATTGSGSARVRLMARVNGPQETFTVRARGAVDYRRGVGKLRLEVPGVPGTLRQVVTPRAVLVRGAADGSQGHTSWLRKRRGNLLIAGGGSTGADPEALLETLNGARPSYSLLGTEWVAGVETLVYEGETDLRLASRRADARVGRTLAHALHESRKIVVPFRVYVDQGGRLRKLVEIVSMDVPGTGPLEAKLRVSLSRFGLDVPVDRPKPKKVVTGATWP